MIAIKRFKQWATLVIVMAFGAHNISHLQTSIQNNAPFGDYTFMPPRKYVTSETETAIEEGEKRHIVHEVRTRFMQNQPNLLHLGRAR